MIGDVVGGYRIVSELGRGGMGVVYLGQHRHLDRRAAVKVLLPGLSGDAEVLERFFREARATASIDHPGIVHVLDCGLDGEQRAFIVMELLEGESLRSLLERVGALPLPEAIDIGRQLASALAAAHARGIVHRDLKPENVMVLVAPLGQVKVLDFGVAKLAQDPRSPQRTRLGTLLGTPRYMSPEQCRGAADVDARSDIYALGCMLFELLSGRPPFPHEEAVALLVAHMNDRPPTLRAVVPAVPQTVADLVERMLAKAREDRPADMDEVGRVLEAAVVGLPKQRTLVLPPAARTMVLPPGQAAPRASSTLRRGSGEVITTKQSERRGRRTIAWIAICGVAGTAALLWLSGGRPGPNARSSTTIADPAPSRPVPLVPTSQSALVRAAPSSIPDDPPLDAAALQATADRPAAPASRLVQVLILSSPAGASICLAGRSHRLGVTGESLALPRGRRTRLVVAKPGFRAAEVAIVPVDGLSRRVSLEPLGPEDLEELSGCQ